METHQADGGWDDDRLVDLAGINDELRCSICSSVCRDAVQCHAQHIFCSICIHAWLTHKGTCPIDRGSLTADKLEPARIARKLVDTYAVRCKFAPHGCNETPTIETIDAHERNCGYNTAEHASHKAGCDAEQTSCVQEPERAGKERAMVPLLPDSRPDDDSFQLETNMPQEERDHRLRLQMEEQKMDPWLKEYQDKRQRQRVMYRDACLRSGDALQSLHVALRHESFVIKEIQRRPPQHGVAYQYQATQSIDTWAAALQNEARYAPQGTLAQQNPHRRSGTHFATTMAQLGYEIDQLEATLPPTRCWIRKCLSSCCSSPWCCAQCQVGFLCE